jgi:hypothetical protein
MSKPFGIAFGVAVAVIAVLVGIGFHTTKGNHLAPVGAIGKLRTLKIADDITLMVVDFNVKNDSDRDMIVRTVDGTIDTTDGAQQSSSVSAADAVEAFRDYPLLGEQYNPVMKARDVVPAHRVLDRMVCLRFDVPYDKVEARKAFTLHVEDVTGPVLELKK